MAQGPRIRFVFVQHGEKTPQLVMIAAHPAFQVRQDHAIKSTGKGSLPAPFDQLFVFLGGNPVDTTAEIAGDPQLRSSSGRL